VSSPVLPSPLIYMDHTQTRRRGGSFHEQEDGNTVQFVTPYYEGGPEPLDLSKLRLENMGEEDNDSGDDEDEEEIYTRGRSRSRSIHANDSNAPVFISSESGQPPIPDNSAENSGDDSGKAGKVERTGPLQQKEIVALQKVLCYSVLCMTYITIFVNYRDWKRQQCHLILTLIERMKRSEWLPSLRSGNVY
jgi:hypothetical protein